MKGAFPVLLCLIFLWSSCETGPQSKTQPEDGTPGDSILDRLNSAIQGSPTNPDLYHERALHFLTLGNYAAAFNDLDRAMRADSSRGKFYLTRGQIYWETQAFKQAYDDFQTCLTKEPQNEDCLLEAANMEIALKNYSEAIQHINTALRQNDYIARAYYMKGRIYKETGDSALAVSSYQTAIEIDPAFYDAYIQLGLLYASADNDLADEYYSTAVSLKPQSVEALYDHAIFLQETGYKDPARYDRANELYDRIIAIDPENAAAYFNKGFIQLEYISALDEGAYERGAALFSQAIEKYPLYFQAFYNRGLCYESMDLKEEAIRDYRKALAIQPDYDPAAIALNRVLDSM